MRQILFLGLAITLGLILILYPFSGLHRGIKAAELRVIWGSEPDSFDPALIRGLLESRFANSLFEGLVSFAPDGLTPVPGIARRWDISEDGLVYTFHLRRSYWSNGDPLTAHDFSYAWLRALDPKLACDYVGMLFFIKGAKRYYKTLAQGETHAANPQDIGIKVLDDYTLQVTLEDPTPFFLDIAGFMTLYPVHKGCVQRYKQDWIKPGNIVCNGPFVLEAWYPNHYVLLKKNPYYWDRANVGLKRVMCVAVKSMHTAFNLYEAGEVDWITVVPWEFLDFLGTRSDLVRYSTFTTGFLRFNVTRPPFDNVDIRKAFAMAINKVQIPQVTRRGELPTDVLVPPGIKGYRSPKGLPYNPHQARRLFSRHYPDPSKFPTTTFLMTDLIPVSLFELLQRQWKDVLGVEVEAKRQEWKIYLSSLAHLDFDIAAGSWVGDYYDPNTFLDMFVTGGGNNNTGWSNPEYDRLIKQAGKEPDQRWRFERFHMAERILVEQQVPIVPLFVSSYYFMAKPYVDGIVPNIMMRFQLKHIRVR
jgi:oligopeptide transport system substrate-binding protein